ncbi:MAG: PEP-CTERM sorting domain-containing protein [Armatimonadetes bacterium]|nr:PEP-CTERM sorting domain-containing protein [Armatimonadota bacterium]
MKTVLSVLAALALASSAHATNLVTNGDFSSNLSGWTTTGVVQVFTAANPNRMDLPASPSGWPAVGRVSSYLASTSHITQSINFTGQGTLSGELWAAGHGSAGVGAVSATVLWNGSVVGSLSQVPDPVKWEMDYVWTTFSGTVIGTGANTLQVNFVVPSVETAWSAVDNLNLVVVPEPGSMIALATGLLGFAGCAFRVKK